MIKSNEAVDKVFDDYPGFVRDKMMFLRKLVHETAKEIHLESLEETLKWGEPSFVNKYGSTLRMDWKAKNPNQYAMYFQCTSRLVETFRLVFGATFQYEGKRAIVFDLEEEIPIESLKKCIKASLLYHKVKSDPTLGI